MLCSNKLNKISGLKKMIEIFFKNSIHDFVLLKTHISIVSSKQKYISNIFNEKPKVLPRNNYLLNGKLCITFHLF